MVITRAPSPAFMRKMDDIVWSDDTVDAYRAVYQLILEEMRRSILPFDTHPAEQWAERKAAEHRDIALKIKKIKKTVIPPDSCESVERLHQHHYRIATRYTRASEACACA